jgi:predicted nucleic acid-binding protein
MLTMPETTEIVINTGPVLALVAALGDLQVLQMYQRVWVPFEVSQEIRTGGTQHFAVAEFEAAHWLQREAVPLSLTPWLRNTLDQGEASVIQLALNRHIQTVCIDETAGRRVARLSGLNVTGSVGVLLRARQSGATFSMQVAMQRMRERGIWLSERVMAFALAQERQIK